MALLIVGLYIALAFLEIPPLIQKKDRKQVVVYCMLYIGALVISVLLTLQVKLPSPADPIDRLLTLIKGYLGGG